MSSDAEPDAFAPGYIAAQSSGRIVPVAKFYRFCPETQFRDTLIVRTMVELIESRRMDTCSLNGLIIEYYHENLRNTAVNTRPASWSDKPFEYLKHAFWPTQVEWDEYEAAVRLRGKPSPTNPEAGIPAELQKLAVSKFKRWQFLKAEILNVTHAEWVKLFPNGQMASGSAGIHEYVEKLRIILFKKWCFEPTSKGSTIVYKAQPIPDKFIPFTTWHLWVAIGPCAGSKCRAVFNNECCQPAAPPNAKNGADTSELPTGVNAIAAALQQDKTKFFSRSAMRIHESPQRKQPSGGVDSSVSSVKDQIKSLKYLVKCDLTSPTDKLKYSERLHQAHVSVLNAGLSPLTQSSATTDTETVEQASSSRDNSPLDSTVHAGPHMQTLIDVTNTKAQQLFETYRPPHTLSLGASFVDSVAPQRLFGTGTETFQSMQCCLSGSILPIEQYLNWLSEKKTLHIVPAIRCGSCLFQSALHGIKEIVHNNPSYRPWGASPKWKEFTCSDFRHHVLRLMEDSISIAFTELQFTGFDNFESLILDEGDHGISRHERRGCVEPAVFSDCEAYFELMKDESAYGNFACLVGIAIFFKVQLHVWMFGSKEPVIHNPTAKHAINLFKADTSHHYDGLSHSNDLQFLRAESGYVYDIDSCEQHGGRGDAGSCIHCTQGNGHLIYRNGVISQLDFEDLEGMIDASADAAHSACDATVRIHASVPAAVLSLSTSTPHLAHIAPILPTNSLNVPSPCGAAVRIHAPADALDVLAAPSTAPGAVITPLAHNAAILPTNSLNVPPPPNAALYIMKSETKEGFLDRLVATQGLHIVPAESKGYCFFSATLFGLKQLYYGSKRGSGYMPKVAVSSLDVASMRTNVLQFMQNCIDTSFPLLQHHGYNSFKEMIVDEGCHHGIVDFARRDMGLPSQRYSTADEYFNLMREQGAYANLSVLLATAIVFDVTICVWMFREESPYTYQSSETNEHVVNVVKFDKENHYDGLTNIADLSFLRNPPAGDNTYTFDVDSCLFHGGLGNHDSCKPCNSGDAL
jgi:hypothetical protein